MSNEEGNNPSRENDKKEKEIIEKGPLPLFIPTYRIKINLFPLPVIIVISIAGLLAYLTYFVAGVQIDGGYIPEEDYGPLAGLLNGIIFTAISVISAFIIVFLAKKKGVKVLKYIFGFTFGYLGFFLTWFFTSIIIYLIFIMFPETPTLVTAYYITSEIISPVVVGGFTFFILYKYFKSQSIFTKNLIVLYISLLISASMGILMPLWTTTALLIGISFWDIYGVLTKKGPIREMIELASRSINSTSDDLEIEDLVKSGEAVYDTSKVEIGIGDLAFYSMLTSSSLIQTNNLFVMILTAIAILIGMGITLMGLKRNKVLPGLPISIFLGLGTMFLSWYLFTIL